MQPSEDEQFIALKKEIKKDKEALEMQLPNIEPKLDANMIANIDTNSKNFNREMYAIMERVATQADELEKLLKEQSPRKLPSDIKSDDIWESENVTLSLEDESLSLKLDEDKDIMECNKITLVLEEELQKSTLVEKNEFAFDEELLLKEKQVEKQHLELIMENVLVGVEDFSFPINSLIFSMEEDQQVSCVLYLPMPQVKCGLKLKMGK